MGRFIFVMLVRLALIVGCVHLLVNSIADHRNFDIVMWVLVGAVVTSYRPRLVAK